MNEKWKEEIRNIIEEKMNCVEVWDTSQKVYNDMTNEICAEERYWLIEQKARWDGDPLLLIWIDDINVGEISYKIERLIRDFDEDETEEEIEDDYEGWILSEWDVNWYYCNEEELDIIDSIIIMETLVNG